MSRIFTLIKNSLGGSVASNSRAIAKERLSIMLTEQRSQLSASETSALLKEVEATVMKYAKVSSSKTPTFAVLKDARDLYYLEFHFPLEDRKISGVNMETALSGTAKHMETAISGTAKNINTAL